MRYNYAYIDFEFNNTSEKYVNLVCCVLKYVNVMESYWLHNNEKEKIALVSRLMYLMDNGYVFVSYAMEAEARSFAALGIRLIPCLRSKVLLSVDLYIQYRQLSNHFDDICYGEHLIDGKVKTLRKPKPKWDRIETIEDEESGAIGGKQEYGLASATYKFLGEIRDTEDKDRCRERIIAGGEFTEEEKQWILTYCAEDVRHLPKLHEAMWYRYEELGVSEEALIGLSEYAIRTAVMVEHGYPVDRQWLQRITDAVPWLVRELQRECQDNSPELKMFSWQRKTKTFAENQKIIKDYIEKKYPHALKTDPSKTCPEGQIALSEEALERLKSPPGHPLTPIDNFIKYRKLRKSLSGFKAADGKKTIWDYVGCDDRVRPYFGIFGAQTSRSQPSSTSFIFLKSKVLRHLVRPKPGRCIIAIDYKSQEFLIGAILSGDDAMIEAYTSGDAYIYLAKQCGAVPLTATKNSHPVERDLYKKLELAIGYGMGAESMGREIGVSTERAQELIDQRAGVYWKFIEWRKSLIRLYKREEKLVLPDGWTLGGGNDNRLSMQNFPGQGHGGVVMRKAVQKCQDADIQIIQTLHDALYGECDIEALDETTDAMNSLMIQAFADVLDGAAIKTDIHVWGIPGERREMKTSKGTSYVCEDIFWDEGRVSEQDHKKWVGFMNPDPDGW